MHCDNAKGVYIWPTQWRDKDSNTLWDMLNEFTLAIQIKTDREKKIIGYNCY